MSKPDYLSVVTALEDNIQMLEITMSTTGHIDAMCDEAIKEGKAALPLARSMVEMLEAVKAYDYAISALEKEHGRKDMELTQHSKLVPIRELARKL